MKDQILNKAPTVLTKIVKQRLQTLEELKTLYPEDEVIERAQSINRGEQTRSLQAGLSKLDAGFILECKKASPSKGLIRSDFDPVKIAKVYQPYACAISVLTEPDFFQGDFAYLQAVSAQTHLPVLCKDFFVTKYHVALAKYFGADAILLMLSILNDEQYLALRQFAKSLGLEVLTEVGNEPEMKRTHALKPEIIGINNRDLHDLSINLTQTEKLASLAPAETILVAESGYDSNNSIRRHAPLVNGFLVGSHLTLQPDIDLACRELIYGNHKVCGLTHPRDAIVAAASGAVFGGLIQVHRSPRKVELAQAAVISQEVPSLKYVGVFSASNNDFSVELVLDWVRSARLSAVQIHDVLNASVESETLLRELRDQLPPNCKIWFAAAITPEQPNLPNFAVDKWLVDHGAGGTGKSFDWALLPSERHQLILAGGLGPDNIQAALKQGCSGMDFNSKLEVSPGQKDPLKVNTVFKNMRAYGRKRAAMQEVE